MQYWIPKSLVLGIAVSLSGCSIFTNDAHHERNYRANAPVKAPEGLAQPYRDPEFAMPVGQYENTAEPVSYRAPQQVLTVAQGSWVEQGEEAARIFFDKNDGIEDLPAFIWRAVDGVVAMHNAGLESDNKAQGSVTTTWYSLIKAKEGWFWEEATEPSKQKFKFTLEQKEHQRTASLRAELVDYQGDGELTALQKNHLEVRALNEVVSEFDYQYRLLQVEMRKRQGVLALELGFDKNGDSALLTEKGQEAVLDRFSNFLERSNFTVVRVDREKQEVLVRYEAPESSVWDSIWGEEAVVLPIDNGDYTIKIAQAQDTRTSITWKDSEGNVLDANTMNNLHQALITLLRQKGLTI
ncbi:outer membrane protein assembly factor BamC [Pseudoalteromonas sp. S2755]|uniref:outer membrane protein assembly factor BamC n=1 Tax=Pseudoalteromonas sp. S2755 TaxID=2066523 RepID=UPI00110C0B58|nr:outer membrane protein assembly factor BamC [Pseudoalteromonas sp. S2755]TMN34990.1 outer membrane assembly protein BamC [Pseudoalteromonas sp. S2755]